MPNLDLETIVTPLTLHYLDDAARGLITMADHDTADGGIWHLPPITGVETRPVGAWPSVGTIDRAVRGLTRGLRRGR